MIAICRSDNDKKWHKIFQECSAISHENIGSNCILGIKCSSQSKQILKRVTLGEEIMHSRLKTRESRVGESRVGEVLSALMSGNATLFLH